MAQQNEIRALMPDLIDGKTHDQMRDRMKALDEEMGAHCVDGVKLPWIVPKSNLEALKTFDVRDDDVFIVAYPRSGFHWTDEILRLILHGGKDEWDRAVTSAGFEITHAPDPSLLDSTVPGYKIQEMMQSPRVIGTHCRERFLPPRVWTKKAKVVYVARNPKDVLISSSKIVPSLLRSTILSFDELLWAFYFDETIFGSWFDHVLEYWKHKDDANVFFLKYEDLHKDLRGSICKLAKHLGKDLSDDVIDSILERVSFGGMQKTYQKLEEVHGEKAKAMTHLFGNTSTPYLRKGKVGDWKNTFTVAQSALFDKVYALKMKGSDLEFDFEL